MKNQNNKPENIELLYDVYYDVWEEAITKAIKERKLYCDDKMVKIITSSLRHTVDKFLIEAGYKPKTYLQYRKNLVKRLAEHGLKLTIKTNELLWLYLEYFTDITNYSKCFDIHIDVFDEKLTLNTCAFKVRNNRITGITDTLIESKSKTNVDGLLLLLEKQSSTDPTLKIITKILQELNSRSD